MSVAVPASRTADTGDLDQLIERFHVPGASVAEWRDGALSEAAAGVVNLNTQVAATPDTLFQIGSITKLYTTVLVLQLAEQGLLSLDDRVRQHLPDFRMGDAETSENVTIRHLLSHTSGIDGDYFVDAGRGEDRIERFVGMLGDLPSLHPLGAMFAYCNVGFVIAGRIVEKLTGLTWDKAMRQRIAKPIDTPQLSTLPEQALRYRTAIGHVGNPEKGLMVTPLAYLAQSNAPAGSTPMASAADLIPFARALMEGGTAPNGHTLLSAASAALLREPHVTCPPGGPMDAIGLGAFLWNWGGGDGYDVFGHDGSTIGQAAFLRIHPASGTIVALLTNGGDGKGLSQTLMTRIFSSAAGIAPPDKPVPLAATDEDIAAFTGRYEKWSETATVTLKDGALVCAIQPSASYGVITPPGETVLQPVGPGRFIGRSAGMSQPVNFNFLDPDQTGRAMYLYTGARLFPRRGE